MTQDDLTQKLLPLAESFATQIAHIVEADTRRLVAQEVQQRLNAFKTGMISAPTKAMPAQASPAARIQAPAKPQAPRKIVVICPVPGCTQQGVRTLANFCVEHNRALSPPEKQRLREAQRQSRMRSQPGQMTSQPAAQAS